MTKSIHQRLNDSEFAEIFIREFNWSLPRGIQNRLILSEIDGETYLVRPLAAYQGLVAWQCTSLPSRAVRSEIAHVLSNYCSDFVMVFTDKINQVWAWPTITETRMSFRRLTAQHHRIGDRNDALARRLERFKVNDAMTSSVADLLMAVKKGFDTDVEAALRIADLHAHLIEVGLVGTDLEVLLTRLLFLFFGEDTELFARGPYDGGVEVVGAHSGGDEFRNLLLQFPNGRGFKEVLNDLFTALNTPIEKRRGLSPLVEGFPYVNGGLFSDVKPIPEFDEKLISLVLACSDLDWSDISPAIFGSMFEGLLENSIEHVVNSDEGHVSTRRKLGAHYTSEANILRVIRPLFLDALTLDLELAGQDARALEELHTRISGLTFFDPACGCGNFLVVTYKELRHLENRILERLISIGALRPEDVPGAMVVRIDQFFGIEISASATQVAQVALWITDHQLNVEAFENFGKVRHSIPLSETPGIVRADALVHPWDEVIPAEDCDFIIGNPPYLGKSNQDEGQKASFSVAMSLATGPAAIRDPGQLDFVCGWLVKAADFAKRSSGGGIKQLSIFEESADAWGKINHNADLIASRLRGISDPAGTRFAFVTTNSITQGQQVAQIWPWLFSQGLSIQFAYTSFRWSNNAPGAAHVSCVILGLGFSPLQQNLLFGNNADNSSDAGALAVPRISPYLFPGDHSVVESRQSPLFAVRKAVFGNMPNDGGHLLLSAEDAANLESHFPDSAAYVRDFFGAREFLNRSPRKCLWFDGMSLEEVLALPWARPSVERVGGYRLASSRSATRNLASVPHLFGEIRHTGADYLVIPCHLPGDRKYFVMGFETGHSISSNANLMLPDATLLDFGVLSSALHNAWIRFTAGGLGDGLRYSATLVYNTFPWPQDIAQPDREEIEARARGILEARNMFPGQTLTNLYGGDRMPQELRQAHQALDVAVDSAYGFGGPDDELERFRFLMPRYLEKCRELGEI
jgi:hypothetical protein